MAVNPRSRGPLRAVAVLLLVVFGLYGAVAAANIWGSGSSTPQLGLDLEGGTQMVLEPVLEDPDASVNAGQLEKARDIIVQRVDSYGVTEAEVTTQGGRNIVVSIPGTPDAKTLDAIRKPSQMRFRAVLAAAAGTPQAEGSTSDTPTATATPTPTPTETTPAPLFTRDATSEPDPQATSANAVVPPALVQDDPTGGATTGSEAAPSDASDTSSPQGTPTPSPTDASDPAWITPDIAAAFAALDCTAPNAITDVVDDPQQPLVTCSADGTTKYILGPVELDGTDVADAQSGYQPGPTGQPTTTVEVTLTFTGDGAAKFAAVTQRLYALSGSPPRNQFAAVLDKFVISAPRAEAVITDGRASITGDFTLDSARSLAQQLKFGALPMSFQLQTQEDISPTLGAEQLKLGLIAGAIGLLLVVVYSLIQYRMLGLVTVASLLVAAVLTYGVLTLLGWAYNFRLTMAGVTGVIVAIGVTADSFIVYFERVRDEVRDGRGLTAAVEAGWVRARRTILAADAVNFLAALVLYLLAASNVRGFAFALGVTTLIDLVVVVFFTHPVVALLARTRFFGGGHPWSGLDPKRLGAKQPRYRGRGQFAAPGAARVADTPAGGAR